MNEHADTPLPDEIEMVQALVEAVVALNGELRPADGGWELQLPGVSALAVSATDAVAFPLALTTPSGWLALPACADVAELSEALRVTVLRQPARTAVDLSACRPAGWQPVSAEASRIELARTDQSARGWPATATVKLASDAAIVETKQVLAIGNGATQPAVDHLLARASRGLVQICRGPGSDGASRMTSARTSAPDLPAQTICYRLVPPASLLTPARLGDALTLIGACYRDLAPVLTALAEHAALSETYLILNRRSK